MSKLIRLMKEAMLRLPSGEELTFKVELHPEPCPRCGGKQCVDQVEGGANCLDFDCYIASRREDP